MIKTLLRMAAPLFCVWAGAAAHAQNFPLPAAGAVLAGDRTLPAQQAADGLLLPVRFTPSADRVYWDIPLDGRISADTSALVLDLSCPDSAPLRGLSVHLQSGKGWYNATAPVFTAGAHRRVVLPRGLFAPEGTPGSWHKAGLLRLSVWRLTDGAAALTLHGIRFRTDRTALVHATALTAPGETGLAASLADRCARLLTKAGIPFAVVDDTDETLDTFKLILLPYAPKLPADILKRLEKAVARNGKLIVFYNASQPLGVLLGIRPGSWQGTPAEESWSALVCNRAQLPGLPDRVPHVTNSILPPFATSRHHARTIATWADETGRVTDQPACVLSDRGAWFAHVPPLAYPSAAALLRTLVLTLAPDLPADPPPAASADAIRLPEAAVNEIRAAWYTAAVPRHPRGWNGLMPMLAAGGINTLFIRCPLDPEGKAASAPASFKDAVEAGARHGIAVHAWVFCWALESASADAQNRLAQSHRLMCDAAGKPLPWLCPSVAENRQRLIEAFSRLARSGVRGIQLDYLRYPENTGCYAPATRQAFETALHRRAASWPADVLPGGPLAADYQTFRRDTLTAFLRDARAALRDAAPALRLSAAVFPSPAAAAERGQDWPAWVKAGLVDFACPMIYTEDAARFGTALDACMRAVPNPAATLLPGIGTGADESQLDVAETASQIALVRTRRLPGFAFFAADDELRDVILPSLKLK